MCEYNIGIIGGKYVDLDSSYSLKIESELNGGENWRKAYFFSSHLAFDSIPFPEGHSNKFWKKKHTIASFKIEK
jgi:hypothetical protein